MAALNGVANRPQEGLPQGVRDGFDFAQKLTDLDAVVTAEVERNWLDAAEAAQNTNQSTVAVLPIGVALSPTGYVAKLQARGFAVEEPR